VSGYELFKRLS